jgi:glycogen debranching enzyme
MRVEPGRGPAFPYLAPSLQEWLETDGLGGFASSTAAGIHTRRYHGWLFLAGPEPGDRFLALSKLHDVAHAPQGDFDLSTSYYPGGLHPEGVKHQWFFRRYPFPAFVFKLGDLFLTRELFMKKGQPGVFCRYLLERPAGSPAGPSEVSIRLYAKPMCNNRSYHRAARAGDWSPRVVPAGPGAVIEGHRAAPMLQLAFYNASFEADPRWYYNMLYPRERERGLDDAEDHFSPGGFTVEISAGSPGYFWAGPLEAGTSVEEFARGLPARYEAARESEVARRQSLVSDGQTASASRGVRREKSRAFWPGWPRLSGLPGRLALAGDQFVVSGRGGESIVAGYHWFGEWGRDSFIALPGILLVTGRFEEARRVFRRFSDAARDGLVPNRFEEAGNAGYNSADASLWMIHALGQYERASGDRRFVVSLLPAVEAIVRAYLSGTAYGVRAGPDGLVRAGTEDVQVTWMDACVNGVPVTPRQGYPVEVNALWISALRSVARWAEACGSARYAEYARLARATQTSFRARFAWPGVGLYDRLTDQGPAREVRPNQVIAAGCMGVALPEDTLREVWNTAVTRLLTPRGLRTLDPSSPDYRGTYRGGPAERDAAYHQGTAWPWLIGPLFDLAAKLDSAAGYRDVAGPRARFVLNRALPGIVQLDQNPCIGSIFEVASGSWPYQTGGAVAQAWSVAEAARVVSRVFAERGSRLEPTSPDARVGVSPAPRRRPGAARVPPRTGADGSGRPGDDRDALV